MNGSHSGKFRDPALVDFGVGSRGAGRRLERFAGILVDRPLPQTGDRRRLPGEWRAAQAVFRLPDTGATDALRGRWEFTGDLPDPWLATVPVGPATLTLEVHPSPSGQVGIFLEQIDQWGWLRRETPGGSPMLSLFAHSGAATLAAAAAGAEVVHVDSSRQSIALARRNAEASGLAHLPVSWVCEDATTFVQRCLRRGRRFSGVILDPPSWGHGPKGESFSLQRDLPSLLGDIARLLDPATPGPILLTCHSPGWHPRKLRDTLSAALRAAAVPAADRIESGLLACTDDTGRTVDLGSFARAAPAP